MRLIGYVDGVEARFDFYPPNEFKAEVPKKGSGIYILELHLYGDNYTVTHKTEALIGIDFRSLEFKFLPLKYKNLAGKLEHEYEEAYKDFDTYETLTFEDSLYSEQIIEPLKYKVKEYVSGYSYTIL